MRRITVLIVLISAASACSSGQANLSGQTTPSNETARSGQANTQDVSNELIQGARAFDSKRVVEAQQRFEKALSLDPSNKKAAILLARVIHSQFRRGDKTPENVAKANEAISAYKKVLALDPNNNEALKNVIGLLKTLERADEKRRWAEERAADVRLTPQNRSELYAFLAGDNWLCSNEVTDNPANQGKLKKRRDVVYHVLKPKNPAEYDKAVRCVTVGLEHAEKAINLDSDSEKAWSQKYNMLLEAKKLAQMDEKIDKAEELAKQAEEALKRANDLYERRKNQVTATPEQSSAETDLDSLVPPSHDLTLIIPVEMDSPTPTKEQPK